MEDLKDIVVALKKIREDTTSKVSDEAIFDCSVRIFNSRNIHRQRGENSLKKSILTSPPASTPQINLLKKLKVEVKKGLTKQEASELIERYKK